MGVRADGDIDRCGARPLVFALDECRARECRAGGEAVRAAAQGSRESERLSGHITSRSRTRGLQILGRDAVMANIDLHPRFSAWREVECEVLELVSIRAATRGRAA